MISYIQCCGEMKLSPDMNPDVPCSNCGTYPMEVIISDLTPTEVLPPLAMGGQGHESAPISAGALDSIMEHVYHYWWAYLWGTILAASLTLAYFAGRGVVPHV